MLRRRSLVLLPLVALLVAFAACGEEGGDDGEGTNDAAQADCNTEEIVTGEGLVYQDIECGTGAEAQQGDTIFVHYTGKLEDATEFDSSRGGEPLPFVLGGGQVIRGWDLGFEGMKVGGKRILTIPPDLGYGAAGAPPDIPPNSTLIFDVELMDVQSPGG